MNYIELKTFAKINLSLDVLNKRSDGYHELRMIMQTIDLHDDIFIEIKEGEGLEVTCDKHYVPSGSDNIAYKAANLMLKKYNIAASLKIHINKNIPVAAGLAGGSSNAAGVLKGINMLFSLGLSDEELMLLGVDVGADVPYCVKGGTRLACGIGEKLTDLPQINGVWIVLVKPPISVSTAWAYNNLKLDNIDLYRPDTDLLINAITSNNIHVLAKNMKNVFESIIEPRYSIITSIKKDLIDFRAIGSMMSGSGPTVFGIFDNFETAVEAYHKMLQNNDGCEYFLTKTTNIY